MFRNRCLAPQGLRDVANDGTDRRRTSPPFIWLGVLPCDCVLQAIDALSLDQSPMAHRWPPFIEHPFLSMQRVSCVDTRATVGALWASGGDEGTDGLRWAYVPVIAFLKQFPAHSPMLLPPGLVHERSFIKPPGRAMDLETRP